MVPTADVLVVDASVAAKWHLPEAGEEHAARALALLAQFQTGKLTLIAPRHIRFEVPSALTVAAAQSRITIAHAQTAIDDFLNLALPTFDDTPLLSAAFPLVTQYRIAFYDAVYLALAQREHVRLITADRKCYNRISHLSDVLWLGDWTPPR